jgi:hypothetical protein
MKYFTAQLWHDLRKDADQQWKRNVKLYRKQLAKILPRLNKKNQRFFDKMSLHDGLIISFSFGDIMKAGLRRNFVQIKVVHPEFNHIYILHYSGVRNLMVKSPDESLCDEYRCAFDDWGFDEISRTKDGWLKHEIFLASHTEIKIEFKSFSYKIEKFKNIVAMQNAVKKANM